jgi:hypothetical protein
LENKPVYPRPNPEYDRIVYEQLLQRMRNMRWDNPEDCQRKPRGRKPQRYVRPESRPRSEGERQAYDWFKKAK